MRADVKAGQGRPGGSPISPTERTPPTREGAMDLRPSQEHEMFRTAVARFAREKLVQHVKTMEETDKFPV